MNKNTLIKIAIGVLVVLILGGSLYCINYKGKKDSHGCFVNKGYSWCDFKNKCVESEKEDCNLTAEWVIAEGKKVIGLDINVMGQTFKWNKEGEELVLDAKGCYYSDALRAEKTITGFSDLDNFFKNTGFSLDSYNPPVDSENENLRIYKKDKIVCQLKRIDNPNNTTSLSFFCSDENNTMCGFGKDCGRKCETDSDCVIFVNSCAKKVVCRNKNYKFYHDCENPASSLQDIDVAITHCKCSDNLCVPTKDSLRDKNF